MVISILTLFPEIFKGSLSVSILKRAQEKKAVKFNLVNIRDFAEDKHRTVDDHPYGGGVGMVMRVDVIDAAMSNVKYQISNGKTKTVLLDPRGKAFTQAKAREYATLNHLILVCGHYEGIDERIKEFVDEAISIGEYILTGGELPAMVIADSVVRLLPGVLKEEATTLESFSAAGLLEHPQYTRPEEYKGMRVPEVLLSGNHAQIDKWRKRQALLRTQKRRPDLLKGKRGQV